MLNNNKNIKRKISQDYSNITFPSLQNLLLDLEKLENNYLSRVQKDQFLLSQAKEKNFLDHKKMFEKISHILHSPKLFDQFIKNAEISRFITTLPVKPPVHLISEEYETILAEKIFSIQYFSRKSLQKYPTIKQKKISEDEHSFSDKELNSLLNKLFKEKELPFLQTIIQPSYLESYKLWFECVYFLENGHIVLRSSLQSPYSSTERYILSLPEANNINSHSTFPYKKIYSFQFNRNVWSQAFEYLTKNIQPNQHMQKIFPFFKIL